MNSVLGRMSYPSLIHRLHPRHGNFESRLPQPAVECFYIQSYFKTVSIGICQMWISWPPGSTANWTGSSSVAEILWQKHLVLYWLHGISMSAQSEVYVFSPEIPFLSAPIKMKDIPVILKALDWPRRMWFSNLINFLVDALWTLPHQPDLQSQGLVYNPAAELLALMAWPLKPRY